MEKVKIVTIKITKSTPDLSEDARKDEDGNPTKVYEPGRHIMCTYDRAKIYLDKKVAELVKGNPLFNKIKKED